MYMWRRLRAVTYTAADTQTARTFKTWIICLRCDMELAVELLKTKYPVAKRTFYSSKPLAALDLTTQMASLRTFFCFIFIHL